MEPQYQFSNGNTDRRIFPATLAVGHRINPDSSLLSNLLLVIFHLLTLYRKVTGNAGHWDQLYEKARAMQRMVMLRLGDCHDLDWGSLFGDAQSKAETTEKGNTKSQCQK